MKEVRWAITVHMSDGKVFEGYALYYDFRTGAEVADAFLSQNSNFIGLCRLDNKGMIAVRKDNISAVSFSKLEDD